VIYMEFPIWLKALIIPTVLITLLLIGFGFAIGTNILEPRWTADARTQSELGCSSCDGDGLCATGSEINICKNWVTEFFEGDRDCGVLGLTPPDSAYCSKMTENYRVRTNVGNALQKGTEFFDRPGIIDPEY